MRLAYTEDLKSRLAEYLKYIQDNEKEMFKIVFRNLRDIMDFWQQGFSRWPLYLGYSEASALSKVFDSVFKEIFQGKQNIDGVDASKYMGSVVYVLLVAVYEGKELPSQELQNLIRFLSRSVELLNK